MTLDRLFRLDLKLLVGFIALLEERSASRAALRLHLSQSAISKLLGRLRELFDDPLFVRVPHGLEPTPRAIQLEGGVRLALRQLMTAVEPETFSPEHSQRHFMLASIGSAYPVLLTGLFGRIQTLAPGVTMNCYDWQPDSINQLQQGRIELAVIAKEVTDNPTYGTSGLPRSLRYRELAQDCNVCLMRKGHPVLSGKAWDLATYLSQSHVQVYCEGRDYWLLDYRLDQMNLRRNITVRVPDFHAALSICEHSDLIFTALNLFAGEVLKHHAVVRHPLPFSLEPVTYLLVWHERYDNDSAHIWLRERIMEHVRSRMTPEVCEPL